MIRKGLGYSLAALLLAAGSAAADPLAKLEPRWTPTVLQTLITGETVVFLPSHKADHGGVLGAAIYIQRPKDQVWNVITNPSDHPKYLKGIKSSDVVQNGGNTLVVDHRIKMSVLPMTVKYRYQIQKRPEAEMNFKLLSGDIREFRGHWRLLDAKSLLGREGTVIFYRIHLDPGGLVPSAIVQKSLRGDVPGMLERTRERIYKLHGSGVAMR